MFAFQNSPLLRGSRIHALIVSKIMKVTVLFPRLLILPLLLCFTAQAQTSNVTLTIITNSLEGGTILGGGIYASGATAAVQIQALAGWYITNVVPVPQPSSLLNYQKLAILDELENGSLTNITSDNESIVLNSNTTLTVTFAEANPTVLPTITQEPASETVLTGSTVTLMGAATGYLPLSYQWFLNSNAVPNAISFALTFADVQPSNSGNYSLTITNVDGATNSSLAVLTVKDLVVFTNGVAITVSAVTNLSQVTISLQSRFTNGLIFYTLDGSTPDFGSISYSGPFILTTNSTLRAIAYSADLSQTVVSDSVDVTIIPTFSFGADSNGGGTVSVSPSLPAYVSNSVVTVVATPNPGFTLMGWQYALSGTNLTNTVVITNNMTAAAYFGTTLTTTTNGSGSISLFPAFAMYPYGMSVTLFAHPNPGNYLGLWGGAASGSQNPLSFQVVTANPTVSALFGSLPTNQVSLTLSWDGAGYVIANPATNKYSAGTTVLLTAYSYGGQFQGWGGAASGTTNPLSVVLNSNETITAHFNHSPELNASRVGNALQFELYGYFGDIYTIQSSTGGLTNWPRFTRSTTYLIARLYF